jgi:RNA polymerase sigma-70 factor (ECF subfamily)
VRDLDFGEIVRENQAMVFSIAYHFLHDRDLAEELAQDVFLQLFKSLPDLKSKEHVMFWLRKVASHRCVDYARYRKWRPKVGLEDAPEPVAVAPRGDPMLARRLSQLVASLPEKQRLVVILRFQEDLDPEDIARVLEIPVGTVKSQLQRSLAILREKVTRSLGGVHA